MMGSISRHTFNEQQKQTRNTTEGPTAEKHKQRSNTRGGTQYTNTCMQRQSRNTFREADTDKFGACCYNHVSIFRPPLNKQQKQTRNTAEGSDTKQQKQRSRRRGGTRQEKQT
eukprot:12033436-Heterocapsa_arctica.AAC.1